MSLAGRRIWVTRPSAQAGALMARLAEAGATPVALPLLEIAEPLDPAPFSESLTRLDDFDLVVFVSPTALDVTLAQCQWPATLTAAVVGPGSAARAKALGISRVISPAKQYDSEGLLAELDRQMTLSGQRVLLIRGDGGRNVLPSGLIARGADVTSIAAYRRLPPVFDSAHLAQELAQGVDGVIISSSEAAQHLFALIGAVTLEQLQSLRYFAPHPRIAAALAQHGALVTLTDAGDEGVVTSLCRYFSTTS
ncbi:uroporphyrinogen-III synthase [Chitinibacteraceae bacterium HSL-7]